MKDFDLDAFLLGSFEKIAHRIQRFCGITCFRLAIMASMAWMCLLSILCLIGITSIIFWVIGLVCSQKFQDEVAEASTHCPPFRNPLEHRYSAGRQFVLILLLLYPFIFELGLIDVIYISLISLHVMSIYFASCTPLPPGDSTLKKWREALKTKFAAETEPDAEPVPA